MRKPGVGRRVVTVVFLVAVTLSPVAWVQADRISKLKSRIEELEERIVTLEEKSESPGEEGLLSLKGGKFAIGGILEIEYVDTQDDTLIDNAAPHFQLDKAVLIPQVSIGEKIELRGEFNFNADNAFGEEIHVTFRELPADCWLKAGLDERFIYRSSRITETYPLLGTAFWRYESIGLTLGGEPRECLYWRAFLGNGNPLGTKQVAEDNSYKITSDRRGSTDTKRAKELGLGLGKGHDWGEKGKTDILGFGYIDKLSDAEKSHLEGINGYGSSDDDTQNRYGIRITHRLKSLQVVGEYIGANDGNLERDGWYLEPSYRIEVENREWFNVFTPLLRYNRLDVGLDPVPGDSETWDNEQTTLGLVTQIRKNVLLKTEYNINKEDTGGAEVDNNELLVQLQVKF